MIRYAHFSNCKMQLNFRSGSTAGHFKCFESILWTISFWNKFKLNHKVAADYFLSKMWRWGPKEVARRIVLAYSILTRQAKEKIRNPVVSTDVYYSYTTWYMAIESLLVWIRWWSKKTKVVGASSKCLYYWGKCIIHNWTMLLNSTWMNNPLFAVG